MIADAEVAAARPRILPRLERLFGRLAVVSMLGILVMAAITLADVLMRNLSLPPIPGIVDATQLFMMYSVFLAISYAFATRGHVAVTLLVDRLPDRANRMLGVLWWLAGLGLCLVLSYAATFQAVTAMAYGDSSQTLGLPMVVYWLPVAAGLALSGLGAVLAAIAEWHGNDAAPLD